MKTLIGTEHRQQQDAGELACMGSAMSWKSGGGMGMGHRLTVAPRWYNGVIEMKFLWSPCAVRVMVLNMLLANYSFRYNNARKLSIGRYGFLLLGVFCFVFFFLLFLLAILSFVSVGHCSRTGFFSK